MPDELLSRLRRTWQQTGAPEDGARWLAERVRAGDLSDDRLSLVSYLGHPAARLAVDLAGPEPRHALEAEVFAALARRLLEDPGFPGTSPLGPARTRRDTDGYVVRHDTTLLAPRDAHASLADFWLDVATWRAERADRPLDPAAPWPILEWARVRDAFPIDADDLSPRDVRHLEGRPVRAWVLSQRNEETLLESTAERTWSRTEVEVERPDLP